MLWNKPVIPPVVMRAYTSGLGNYIDPGRPLWSLMQKKYVALWWWSLDRGKIDKSKVVPDTFGIDEDLVAVTRLPEAALVIPTGWRFAASEGDLYGGCHVGSIKVEALPTLTGFSHDAKILTFMESWEKVRALSPSKGVEATGPFELRGLSIRWLHFEAFWLHTKDGKGDFVIPYTGFVPDKLRRMQLYSVKAFLDAIWPSPPSPPNSGT
jgi:hypothetical protein